MTRDEYLDDLLDERFPGRWARKPPPPPPTDLEMARRWHALQVASNIPYRPTREKRTA